MGDENLGEIELNESKEYIQMGQTLLGNNNYEDAILFFDKALKLEPMDETAYMSKGIAFALLERYEEAKECFTRASMINTKLADAYFQLGNLAFIAEQFEEGIKLYNQATSLGYQSADLYYNLALVYEEKNEYDVAIRYYGKAYLADDTNPVYLIRKATLQIISLKYTEALQTLEILRDKFPESFEGYHLSAAAYTMMEKYDDAVKILNFAIQLFPEDKDLILDKMRVLVTMGDIESAQKIIHDAYSMENCSNEDKKELLLNEAKIYGMKQEFDKAENCLKNALQINCNMQENPEIIYLLTSLYLIQRKYDKMLETSRLADRNDKDNAFSLFGPYFEGVALKQLQDSSYKKVFQECIQYYRKISMDNPSRIDSYLFRAMCHKELENYDKAIECLDYILLLYPEQGKIHFIKANILHAAGREDEAKVCYTESKRLGYSADVFDAIWEGV